MELFCKQKKFIWQQASSIKCIQSKEEKFSSEMNNYRDNAISVSCTSALQYYCHYVCLSTQRSIKFQVHKQHYIYNFSSQKEHSESFNADTYSSFVVVKHTTKCEKDCLAYINITCKFFRWNCSYLQFICWGQMVCMATPIIQARTEVTTTTDSSLLCKVGCCVGYNFTFSCYISTIFAEVYIFLSEGQFIQPLKCKYGNFFNNMSTPSLPKQEMVTPPLSLTNHTYVFLNILMWLWPKIQERGNTPDRVVRLYNVTAQPCLPTIRHYFFLAYITVIWVHSFI